MTTLFAQLSPTGQRFLNDFKCSLETTRQRELIEVNERSTRINLTILDKIEIPQ